VCFGPGLPGDEHDGHKGQQPEQRVVTDFFQQSYHQFRQPRRFPGFLDHRLRRRASLAVLHFANSSVRATNAVNVIVVDVADDKHLEYVSILES